VEGVGASPASADETTNCYDYQAAGATFRRRTQAPRPRTGAAVRANAKPAGAGLVKLVLPSTLRVIEPALLKFRVRISVIE
jgi:hypothetical protein